MIDVAITTSPSCRPATTLRRRTLLGASVLTSFSVSPSVHPATAGSPVSNAPIPVGDRLTFRIMRKGSEAGNHSLTFAHDGDTLVTTLVTDIVVRTESIALFRYRQHATVQSKGMEILAIDAQTNNDGKPQQMTARRDAAGLVIEGSTTPRYLAPPHAQAATFWNPATLAVPLISMEDGRLAHPAVTLIGVERVDIATGSVEARHYRLRGDFNLDTFYDLTAVWAGLRFAGKDGADIRYVRT